jgi:tripartite-type tricarboxylate transporter receptor subunit TctC
VDEELTSDKTGKTLFAMRTGPDRAGRPYIAPPGLPADIFKTLTKAFKNCVNDSNFLKDAKKLKLRVEYVSGEDCLKEVNIVLNQPENIVKEFGKYIKF